MTVDMAALAAATKALYDADLRTPGDDPREAELDAAFEDEVLDDSEQELEVPDDEAEALADEDADTNDGALTVAEDQLVTYKGKTLPAAELFEIKEMATRSTMAAGETRKQAEALAAEALELRTTMETFRDNVLENPTAFTSELAQAGLVDPVDLARSLMAGIKDGGESVIVLLGLLADDEALPVEFVTAFGLENPNHDARKYARSKLKTSREQLAERRRIASLEQQVSAQQAQAEAAKAADEPAPVGNYKNEADVTTALAELAEAYNLPTDPELGLEPTLAAELLTFVQDNPRYEGDLEKAYLALSSRKQGEQAAAAKKAAEQAAAVAAKKRAVTAVNARKTSPAASRTTGARSSGPLSIDDASLVGAAKVFGLKR